MRNRWGHCRRRGWWLGCALALVGCSAVAPLPPGPGLGSRSAPEAASGWQAKPGWAFKRHAVVAAHPLAADAGLAVLRDGGSALDAAVAAQLVLALVEPQSSGIGGGGFLLHADGPQVTAYDGRETAPAAVDEALFLRPDGQPMALAQAAVGGRAVGVPGLVAMLQAAHQAHGRLPWARLVQPAIDLAEAGFPVGERLHALLRVDPALRRDPQAAAHFYRPDGSPWPVGHRLRNPALAQVLRQVAQQGARALAEGPVAADIVRRVRGHASNPGHLAEADLAAYQTRRRAPLCTVWRMRHRVCGMPPPSAGHLVMMQTLGMLQAAEDRLGPVPALQAGGFSVSFLHLYTEAARLAQADRDAYIADPDFVLPPGGDWQRLLAPSYLAARARLLGPGRLDEAPAGQPAGPRPLAGRHPAQPEAGTTHLSVVDGQGRAVALTSSVESAFGARLMSDGGSGLPGGFLLNHQLTDFSFLPADAQGRPIANRVQPGKRPRSSMNPTLVFDATSGELQMVLGSPGGPPIVHYTAKLLLGSLVWGLGLQDAIALPNLASVNELTLLEAGRMPAATVQALRGRGHRVQEVDLTSGLHALQRVGATWTAGADPRREGVAAGD